MLTGKWRRRRQGHLPVDWKGRPASPIAPRAARPRGVAVLWPLLDLWGVCLVRSHAGLNMHFCHFTILHCYVNVFKRERNKMFFFSFLVKILHLVIQISLWPPLQKQETSTDWFPLPRVTCSLSNTCHKTDKRHSQVRESNPRHLLTGSWLGAPYKKLLAPAPLRLDRRWGALPPWHPTVSSS